jgi:hypothetical protein
MIIPSSEVRSSGCDSPVDKRGNRIFDHCRGRASRLCSRPSACSTDDFSCGVLFAEQALPLQENLRCRALFAVLCHYVIGFPGPVIVVVEPLDCTRDLRPARQTLPVRSLKNIVDLQIDPGAGFVVHVVVYMGAG